MEIGGGIYRQLPCAVCADWQEQLERDIPGGKSKTIVPIILTSDKTLYSGSGKATGWPLYMTIGNISDFIRFVPGQHCAQLLALLPVIKGQLFCIFGD